MTPRILVTGAAGYLGGTIIADLLSQSSGLIQAASIHAAVRSAEQAQALSELGVNVIQIDLSDEAAVREAVLENKIDIVVHTASSYDTILEGHLIRILGERKKIGGNEVYFIHSSVTTMFSAEGGWPFGEVRDTDGLYEKEKLIERGNPVRDTHIFVVEEATRCGVKSLIVPLPFIYGRGKGEWKKLSVFIPAIIRSAIKHKVVHRFDVNATPPTAHVSDVAHLYTLLLTSILQHKPIPKNETGYYFAFAHKGNWWNVMQGLANALYERGLVTSADVETWPNDKVAAEYLGFPEMFVRVMGTSGGELVAVNGEKLGWKADWDEERFMGNLDDEVQAVLDLDKVKVSVFDRLGVE